MRNVTTNYPEVSIPTFQGKSVDFTPDANGCSHRMKDRWRYHREWYGRNRGRRGLLSDEHFMVDVTLSEAEASLKSFKHRDEDRLPATWTPATPGGTSGDFRGLAWNALKKASMQVGICLSHRFLPKSDACADIVDRRLVFSFKTGGPAYATALRRCHGDDPNPTPKQSRRSRSYGT